MTDQFCKEVEEPIKRVAWLLPYDPPISPSHSDHYALNLLSKATFRELFPPVLSLVRPISVPLRPPCLRPPARGCYIVSVTLMVLNAILLTLDWV